MNLTSLFAGDKAFQIISKFPDEMLAYELESQGKRADEPYATNRKQLAELFELKTYRAGYQPVALGYHTLSLALERLTTGP